MVMESLFVLFKFEYCLFCPVYRALMMTHMSKYVCIIPLSIVQLYAAFFSNLLLATLPLLVLPDSTPLPCITVAHFCLLRYTSCHKINDACMYIYSAAAATPLPPLHLLHHLFQPRKPSLPLLLPPQLPSLLTPPPVLSLCYCMCLNRYC